MDDRTSVNAWAMPPVKTGRMPAPQDCSTRVRVEQAIFTSIRSAMGEGYRLVAMSPGITAEERAEVARRSPSHGSMCSEDAAAEAISSYELATMRHCVAWSRYAGKEHTARGGQRVHTHLVVLDAAGFLAFACDPFRVQAAMADLLGPEPNVKPGACLDPLELGVAWRQEEAVSAEVLRQACGLAGQMAGGGAVVAFGTDRPMEAMRWGLRLLPLAYRYELGVSANLQYAPSRQCRVTCVPAETTELRRAVQGREVRVVDLRGDGGGEYSTLRAWCGFVSQSRDAGRLLAVARLADEIDRPLDPAVLERVVAICGDAESVHCATVSKLEELVTAYADRLTSHPVEARLTRQILSAAVRQAATLHCVGKR